MTPRYDIDATPVRRMLSHMFAMQNRANAAVNPDWHLAGNRWTRAIMVEGVELLEHYGRWKWWKKQNSKPDLGQCQLELVDIWHFALSHFMAHFSIIDARDAILNEAVMLRIEQAQERAASLEVSDAAFNTAVDALVGAAANDLVDTDAFFALCVMVELPFEKLYAQYIGKNLLHVFRQQYGYKTGRYVKDWNGKEDNLVLEEMMAELTHLTGEELEAAIKQGLLERYTQACADAGWLILETQSGPLLGKREEHAEGSMLRMPLGGLHRLNDTSVLRNPPILES